MSKSYISKIYLQVSSWILLGLVLWTTGWECLVSQHLVMPLDELETFVKKVFNSVWENWSSYLCLSSVLGASLIRCEKLLNCGSWMHLELLALESAEIEVSMSWLQSHESVDFLLCSLSSLYWAQHGFMFSKGTLFYDNIWNLLILIKSQKFDYNLIY